MEKYIAVMCNTSVTAIGEDFDTGNFCPGVAIEAERPLPLLKEASDGTRTVKIFDTYAEAFKAGDAAAEKKLNSLLPKNEMYSHVKFRRVEQFQDSIDRQFSKAAYKPVFIPGHGKAYDKIWNEAKAVLFNVIKIVID